MTETRGRARTRLSRGTAETDDALTRSDRRDAQRLRRIVTLGRIAIAVLFVGGWQLSSERLIPAFYVSSPAAVLERLGSLIRTGELWPHLTQTLLEVALGLLIGVPLGAVLGVALGFSTILGGWLLPYMMALYSLPRVVLAPLFIIWFGVGLISKVTMVVTMVVFVVFYNVYQGVQEIDRDLLDVAKSLRASRLQTLRWIVVPSLVPWLITGLRLSIGIALIGAVIAELIAASQGLGYYIKYSSNLLDVTGVFAGLAVITVVAIALEQLLKRIERRVAPR
ncbi:ABC transporter permease [Mycolicibacterium monacense]|uniref:ABC transporter permease n=3 Tax=Mycobacteriaceae TaxID=1762 RepID=A0AAD1MYQ0_MYCMB|nr:ABC transporter permease [Mycolicibacterium monacense]MDA4102880.1 ABC transporter permease [Mycolicibacterium monacense DSM 44395]OBF55393.1 ABC transporter permease [Mycolicibacterium monacense]ORB15269.1 ABC transporter permease [Mycolicibacterium monacense DSM 44395]QHP86184.1 ABC transporter permease [Mycolicibacterium monacense DSM 44395]BBZ60849.1 ABC transporter permease [Mycolicibacterium monacense]